MSGANKVALITGSTSGIGLACAHALAKRGIDVIVTGFADQAVIDGIINDLKRYGVRAEYVSADLSKVSDIESLCSEVTRLYPDGIDILINNAGLGHACRVDVFPDDKFDLLVAVMLSAPFHLMKRLLPAMKKKGWGRIVNMSSVAGILSAVDMAVYSAVKHGVIGLTKGVALENAQFGITCNAVCPGTTDTPLMRSNNQTKSVMAGLSMDEILTKLATLLPTGTLNTVEQIAELVEFLCLSNASSQMTGAAYLIDQGYSAQ